MKTALVVAIILFCATNAFATDSPFFTDCAKEALKVGMTSGYRGTVSAGIEYSFAAATEPDKTKQAANAYLAWFHFVNAKRIILESIGSTQNPKHLKALKSDLAEVNVLIDMKASNSFGWNKDKVKEMQAATISILEQTIKELDKSCLSIATRSDEPAP